MKKYFIFVLIMTSLVWIGKAGADSWGKGGISTDGPILTTCPYRSYTTCMAALGSAGAGAGATCVNIGGGCWDIQQGAVVSPSEGLQPISGGSLKPGVGTITNASCQTEFNNKTCRANSCPMPTSANETCVTKPSSNYSGQNCYCLESVPQMTDALCRLEFNNNTCRADSCPVPTSSNEICNKKTGSLGECWCLEKKPQTVSSCPPGTSLSPDKCCCIPQ